MNYRSAKDHDKYKHERTALNHTGTVNDNAHGIGLFRKPARPPKPRTCAYRHCAYYKDGASQACCVACSGDMYEDMAQVITSQIQRALTSRGVPLAKALQIAALGMEAVAAALKEQDKGKEST